MSLCKPASAVTSGCVCSAVAGVKIKGLTFLSNFYSFYPRKKIVWKLCLFDLNTTGRCHIIQSFLCSHLHNEFTFTCCTAFYNLTPFTYHVTWSISKVYKKVEIPRSSPFSRFVLEQPWIFYASKSTQSYSIAFFWYNTVRTELTALGSTAY